MKFKHFLCYHLPKQTELTARQEFLQITNVPNFENEIIRMFEVNEKIVFSICGFYKSENSKTPYYIFGTSQAKVFVFPFFYQTNCDNFNYYFLDLKENSNINFIDFKKNNILINTSSGRFVSVKFEQKINLGLYLFYQF